MQTLIDNLKEAPQAQLNPLNVSGLSLVRRGNRVDLLQPLPKAGDFAIGLSAHGVPGRVLGKIEKFDPTNVEKLGELRAFLADKNNYNIDNLPMNTALGYGELVKVLDVSDDSSVAAVQIQPLAGGIAGKVCVLVESHRLSIIPSDLAEHIVRHPEQFPTVATECWAMPINGNPDGIMKLSPGAILPFFNGKDQTFMGQKFICRLVKPNFKDLGLNPEPTVENLINLVLSKLGEPFIWGHKFQGGDLGSFPQEVMNIFLVRQQDRIGRNTGHIASEAGRIIDPAVESVKSGDIAARAGLAYIILLGRDLQRYGSQIFPEAVWDPEAVYAAHMKQRCRLEIPDTRENAPFKGVPPSMYKFPALKPDGSYMTLSEIVGVAPKPADVIKRVIDFGE